MTNVHEHLVWRRRCGNGQCIEVADNKRSEHDPVLVRDSEDANGPRLAFGSDAWMSFLRAIRAGDI